MTNREWMQSLPIKEFYRETCDIGACRKCVHWHVGNCIANEKDTCADGHMRWLEAEHVVYLP